MAKNQEPNIRINTDGTVRDAQPEIKPLSLESIGLSNKVIKEKVVPVILDYAVNEVRKSAGLGKESRLPAKSKAYNISLFFKEVGWSLIGMGFAASLIILFLMVLRKMLVDWSMI